MGVYDIKVFGIVQCVLGELNEGELGSRWPKPAGVKRPLWVWAWGLDPSTAHKRSNLLFDSFPTQISLIFQGKKDTVHNIDVFKYSIY